jgi:hypothetical protein
MPDDGGGEHPERPSAHPDHDAGRAAGCRSLLINAAEHGQPAALYRRLGFVGEIYWYREYQLKKMGP